jgi:hypothetical protein
VAAEQRANAQLAFDDLAQKARVGVGAREDAAGELRLAVGDLDVGADLPLDGNGQRGVVHRAQPHQARMLFHVAAVVVELAGGGCSVRTVVLVGQAGVDRLVLQTGVESGVAALEVEVGAADRACDATAACRETSRRGHWF